MDVNAVFESRFLRPSDLKGRDWTLTIAAFRVESLASKFGGERPRGILAFQGAKKELVVNRTNSLAMQAMWGGESDAWIGRRVTLYPALHEGEPAIRVRGSPDLEAPIDVEIRFPKKAPFVVRLLVTTTVRPTKADEEPES
jgi:hypothetical protein